MVKTHILFVCTGASCRSQMAAGFMNALFPGRVEAYAAGAAPKGLDPMAVRAMAEAGVDISGRQSLGIGHFQGRRFDWVVTVCSGAKEACPAFAGQGRRIHIGFDDPPHLAAGAGNPEEAMDIYRRVRDQIKEFAIRFPASFQALERG